MRNCIIGLCWTILPVAGLLLGLEYTESAYGAIIAGLAGCCLAGCIENYRSKKC